MRGKLVIGTLATLVVALPLPVAAEPAGPQAVTRSLVQNVNPSFTGTAYLWTHINQMAPNQSYWNYDRAEGAKVGFSWDRAVRYRSFFQLGTAPINGSRVLSATFGITLDHSPTGSPTPVSLYESAPISPAVPLTWNNSGSHWKTYLGAASGNAWTAGGQPNMPMEISSVALRDYLQRVADGRSGSMTVALRAPDENNINQWKKFVPTSPKITVVYNNLPRTPTQLNLDRPLPCGTAAAPTPISTTRPQFSAVASDPDGHNLVTRLRFDRADGSLEYELPSSTTTSGAAFSWPAIPAGELVEGGVYSYSAFSTDGTHSSPATGKCWFTVDTTPPQTPTVESADYPDGEPVLNTRTTGAVTLRPASGDTGVREYAYGFQQDKTTMRVKAGPDGTAVIPVTVWPDATGVPTRRLYVRAVDAAGNISPLRPAWRLSAFDNPDPVPHVRGDTNGDGRPDVSMVLDHGYGRTMVWNVTARDGGFHTGTVGWDTGENGGFALYRTHSAQGDFDGDGRTDTALFREEAGRRVSLYLLRSDGNRYDAAPAPVWTSGTASWPLSTARVITGDLDADQLTDIVVQLNSGNANWQALVFRGGALETPATWLQTAAGSGEWAKSAPVLADVDGDERADLVDMRNLTGCRTATSMYRSSGTAFDSTPVALSDSTGYCWERSRPEVADVDGDGRDDIVTVYDYGSTDTGLWVFRSTGTALTPSLWWRVPGEFDPTRAALSTGDYDLDGRDDVALAYATGPTGGRQLWTLRSTGTGFATRVLGWQEPAVGAVAGPRFDIEHRTYELVARHSGKCLQVPGAYTTNATRLTQYSCVQNALHHRFRLVRLAGSDRFEARPGHVPTKCVAVGSATHADGGGVIQWPCSGTGSEQQLTLEYVEGSSYDTVVRLRFAHSGKCAKVVAGSLDNGAQIEQRTCTAEASQQWILRPTLNTPQLTGRYKIRSEVNAGRVVDVAGCNTADGADIRIWDYTACGRWRFESLGDDTYQLLDDTAGKALDVAGCNPINGAVVHLWTPNESDCQRWQIEPSTGGTFSILAVSTGRSLAVAGCSTARGADVIIWTYDGANCQRWFLDPV